MGDKTPSQITEEARSHERRRRWKANALAVLTVLAGVVGAAMDYAAFHEKFPHAAWWAWVFSN